MNKYLRKFLKTLIVMILVFIPLIIAKEIFDFEPKWWQFLIYFLIAFEIWDFMFDVIKEFSETGRPLLGICLGMHLLMTCSEENGLHHGLDIIKGKVVRFKISKKYSAGIKISLSTQIG